MNDISLLRHTRWDLYLPSAVLIAQILAGPSTKGKQIIHWPEANHCLLTCVAEDLNSGQRKIEVVVRAGLEPGTARLPECWPLSHAASFLPKQRSETQLRQPEYKFWLLNRRPVAKVKRTKKTTVTFFTYMWGNINNSYLFVISIKKTKEASLGPSCAFHSSES